MGNALSVLGLYAAFLLPLVAFALWRAPLAVSIAFVGGTLIFPERIAFSFQGLPELGKYELITLGCLTGGLVFQARAFQPIRWLRGPELLALLMVPASFATVLANREGFLNSPPMSPSDGVSLSFTELAGMAIPFLLGSTFFRSVRDLRLLMLTFVVGGLVSSAFILFEAWYSPQLHNIVYGYVQHSWLQLSRLGGWRPMAFMPHGLAMSLFVCSALVATTSAWRIRGPLRFPNSGPASLWLLAMLLLCRSLGALVQASVFVPVAAFTRRTTQLRLAWFFCVVVLAYPVLRMADVFPTNTIVDAAHAIDRDRSLSLAFRFENEDRLVAHARQRPLFGWGGYGRSKNVNDGGPRVVADGFWVIRFSSRGLAGFLTYLGLLILPVGMAYRRRRIVSRHPEGWWISGAALVLAVQAVDTIPNALFTHYPLLLGGALAQVVRRLPAEVAAIEEEDEPPTAPEGRPSGTSNGRPMADLLTGRGRGRGPRAGGP